MAKKQITNKQKARIIQKQIGLSKDNDNQTLLKGTVITRYSKQALIKDIDGCEILCAIRPDIKSVTAGDRIIWQKINPEQGVIVSVENRDSVLYRYSQQGQAKAIAANVTQMLIVIAKLPETSWMLLDSYLIASHILGLEAQIILNKTDLECEATREILNKVYKPLGYKYLETNYLNINSYINLHNILDNQTSVFVGQSGVGKSSMIKAILNLQENKNIKNTETSRNIGSENKKTIEINEGSKNNRSTRSTQTSKDIRINEVSRASNLGQHTTSYSTLYELSGKGRIIDSPGVRQFSLDHLTFRELCHGYQEFRQYINHCKFRDCNHITTPNCAIQTALSTGNISQFRYENFKKLAKNCL